MSQRTFSLPSQTCEPLGQAHSEQVLSALQNGSYACHKTWNPLVQTVSSTDTELSPPGTSEDAELQKG